jgi:rRNA-processing protein FCF1
MANDIKILFIDTNAFLQLRDLKDLPWRDLFPGVRAVDLMIAHCVIEELDQHKTGTNKRRATVPGPP